MANRRRVSSSSRRKRRRMPRDQPHGYSVNGYEFQHPKDKLCSFRSVGTLYAPNNARPDTRVFILKLHHVSHYERVYSRLRRAYEEARVGVPIRFGGVTEHGAFILLDGTWGTHVNERAESDVHTPEEAFIAMYDVEEALGRLNQLDIIPTESRNWSDQVVVRYDMESGRAIGGTILPLAFATVASSTDRPIVLDPLEGIAVYDEDDDSEQSGIHTYMGWNPSDIVLQYGRYHFEHHPLAFEYRAYQRCRLTFDQLKDDGLFLRRLSNRASRPDSHLTANSPWALVPQEYYRSVLGMIRHPGQTFAFVQRGYLTGSLYDKMFRLFSEASSSIDSEFCHFPYQLHIAPEPPVVNDEYKSDADGYYYVLYTYEPYEVHVSGRDNVLARLRNWHARTKDKCRKGMISMNVGEHANSVVIDFTRNDWFILEPHGDERYDNLDVMAPHYLLMDFLDQVAGGARSSVLVDMHGDFFTGWQTRVKQLLWERVGTGLSYDTFNEYNPGFCTYWSAALSLQLMLQPGPIDLRSAQRVIRNSFRSDEELAAIFLAFTHLVHLRFGQ